MNELSPLQSLASKGRYGDTMLAHINPQEAALLKALGGSGTINPETGLPEFFLKKAFKKIKKVLKNAAAPILVPTKAAVQVVRGKPISALKTLTSGLGNSIKEITPYAGMIPGVGPLAGAAIGAAGSALTGGNVLKGAVKGGLSAFAGSKLLGGQGLPGLFQSGGSGALNGLFSGSGPLSGLFGGAQTGGSGLLGDLSFGLPQGGFLGGSGNGGLLGQNGPGGLIFDNLGNILGTTQNSGGFDLGGIGGDVLSGLGNILGGQNGSPLGNVLGNVLGGTQYPQQGGVLSQIGNLLGLGQQPPAAGNQQGSGSNLGGLLLSGGLGALLGSQLGGGGEPVYAAQKDALSAAQKQNFERPGQTLDFQKLQQDASLSGKGITDYVSQNWNKFAGGDYNKPVPQMAKGGALQLLSGPKEFRSSEAQYVEGEGSGRDDLVDAKLSDGEYVFDAETVAMLGDGSNKEGAKRLDKAREELRRHKGKALSKGKFSPNAKSPLQYMMGGRT